MPTTRTGFIALVLSGAIASAILAQTEGPRRPPPPEITLAAGGSVSLPLTLKDGRPVVQATLGGRGPFPFVLDTGASGAVISATFAKAKGLEAIGRAGVASPGSPTVTDVELFQIDRLELGGARVSGLVAAGVDLSGPFPGADDPIGVLSAGMFSGYLVTIDYPGKRVVIAPGELPAADGRSIFEYGATRRIPGLPLSVAGTSFEVDVDTGAPTGITLPADQAAKLPISGKLEDTRPDRRMDRVLTAKEGVIDGSVTIGQFTFERPKIRFVEGSSQGLVGAEVLSRFAITLDSKSRRLRLQEMK
jgi:predicted aspartyl protease